MREHHIHDTRFFENAYIDMEALEDSDGHYPGDLDGIQDRNGHYIIFEKKQALAAKVSEGQLRTLQSLYRDLNATVVIFYGYEYAPLRVELWTPQKKEYVITMPPPDCLKRIKQVWKDATKRKQAPNFTDLIITLQKEAIERL